MAVVGARVSVGTSATRLDASSPTDSVSGQRVTVCNRGSAAVDIGGSGVTSGAGYRLDPGDTWSDVLSSGDDVYAIAASGTVDVHVTRVGV